MKASLNPFHLRMYLRGQEAHGDESSRAELLDGFGPASS
jgi:hypothetical protein